MTARGGTAAVIASGLMACTFNSTRDRGVDAGTSVDGGTTITSVDGGTTITSVDGGTTITSVDGGTTTSMSMDGGTTTMTADAGPIVPLPVGLPANGGGWTFYGPTAGGPNQINGASMDEGGNLWVAGGVQGLFVLPAGATQFENFTMADGLRPYGYMADGSTPPGDKYLNVLSVSGAAAGTAFVGYAGKPPAAGEVDCEGNWDGPDPDPSIYKSGDADKVTLTSTGISVIHYDIFSGPGLVSVELRGREKLCSIYRIRYDKLNDEVWFGGNHGFAMGDPNYAGNANCQWDATTTPPVPTSISSPLTNAYGHEGCSGVLEHVHPAINGYSTNSGGDVVYLTGGYYGVAVDPATQDVWFGGMFRTTKFHYATTGNDYYTAEDETEEASAIPNRIDIWPDEVEEPTIPYPDQLVNDMVSGAAAMADGTLWVSSFTLGMAHIDANGNVLARVSTSDGLSSNNLAAIATDPLDQSVWAGTNFGPGISRLSNGNFTLYGPTPFGFDLANDGVSDIQSFGSGSSRQMIVSFLGTPTKAGAVGIYNGP